MVPGLRGSQTQSIRAWPYLVQLVSRKQVALRRGFSAHITDRDAGISWGKQPREGGG